MCKAKLAKNWVRMRFGGENQEVSYPPELLPNPGSSNKKPNSF